MSAEPNIEDLKNLGIGLIAVAAGILGFNQITEFSGAVPAVVAAALALASREAGQRFSGQFVNAEINVELSKLGTAATFIGAAVSYVASFPFAFILPIYNSFSSKRYESWGYEVDVVWVKRRYYIATFGMTAMLLTAGLAFGLGAHTVSKGISLFALFHLIPLKETWLVNGDTDGSHILMQSGFTWVFFIAVSILGAISPL